MTSIRLMSVDRNELDQIEGVLCEHLDVVSVSRDYERGGEWRRYIEVSGVREKEETDATAA